MSDSTAIIIRPAIATDAPQVSALAYRAKAHWGYPPDWLAAWNDELTISATDLADHAGFVASAEIGIVGVAVLANKGHHCSLEHLWVDPVHHGCGIGRRLVARVRCHPAAMGKAIEVISDPFAAPFYEKLGARRCGGRPAPMPGAPERALPVFEFPPLHDAATHDWPGSS